MYNTETTLGGAPLPSPVFEKGERLRRWQSGAFASREITVFPLPSQAAAAAQGSPGLVRNKVRLVTGIFSLEKLAAS